MHFDGNYQDHEQAGVHHHMNRMRNKASQSEFYPWKLGHPGHDD